MYDIVTVGDVVFDIFVKPEEISVMCPAGKIKGKTCFQPRICLELGDKIPLSDIHHDIGGSAANVAVGLAQLGYKASFIGAIGKDEEGEEILTKLRNRGVNISFIKKMRDIKTNTSIILSHEHERTILVYRGLSDYSKIAIPKTIKTKWFYVGPLGENFEKLYSQIISFVSEKNFNLALNPGGIQIKKGMMALREILRVTKILFVNKEEAEEICSAKRPSLISDLLFELKKMGPEKIVITDGSEGAYYCEGEECFKISAYRSDRKETTGAGDAFSSGVLAALIKGETIGEGVRWGIINSAAVIEKVGAQNGLLGINQIQKKLKTAPYPKSLG